jgi:Signal transduction histidine kinase
MHLCVKLWQMQYVMQMLRNLRCR